MPQISIDDVFREVEACHADYAVVPIENSTEGAIGRTLDLLLTTPLKICGEVVLRIHQHLLSNEPTLERVSKVYSHAQSLAQCHEWLNRSLPRAQRIPVGSNAQAAQLATTEAEAAAIAGQAAAERYALPELASNIEDEPNNTTRFVVLGRHDAGPSGRDKTSLIMSAQNRTGALEPVAGAVFRCRGVDDPARIAPGTPHALGVRLLRRCRWSPRRRIALRSARRACSSGALSEALGSYPVAAYQAD
jgi:chorismate mutase/prephenate dehydratase